MGLNLREELNRHDLVGDEEQEAVIGMLRGYVLDELWDEIRSLLEYALFILVTRSLVEVGDGMYCYSLPCGRTSFIIDPYPLKGGKVKRLGLHNEVAEVVAPILLQAATVLALANEPAPNETADPE